MGDAGLEKKQIEQLREKFADLNARFELELENIDYPEFRAYDRLTYSGNCFVETEDDKRPVRIGGR